MDIKGALKNLSRREKAIAGLTLAVALFVAPYYLLYSPAREKIESRRGELQKLTAEMTALASALKNKAAEETSSAEAPDLPLPETQDLAGLLADISREANLTGVDFISISQEGLLQRGDYAQLRLKLELRARYRPFYDFVRTISDKHRLFMIQSIRYETNEAVYPSGVAVIRAVAYLERK